MTRLVRAIIAAGLALAVLMLAAGACLIIIERAEADVAEWSGGNHAG